MINNDPLVKTKLLGLNLGKYAFGLAVSISDMVALFVIYLFLFVQHICCACCARILRLHSIFTETYTIFKLYFYFCFSVRPSFSYTYNRMQ